MMKRKSHFVLPMLVLAAVLVMDSGCRQDRPKGFPKTYPCSVTLTQEGAPAAGIRVFFYAKGESCPWTIGGETDSGGVAKMKTHGRFDGVPEGTFSVVLEKTETEGGAVQNERNPLSREEMEESKSYTLVNSEYTKMETTPIEITVGGKTSETYEIGPAVRELMEE